MALINEMISIAIRFILCVSVAALDHSENDCVGVAIMSHGDLDKDGDDILFGSDCAPVKLMSLLAPLSGRSDLQKKPKLIFVQVSTRQNK